MSDQHQLIVVANRLPVRNVSDRDGQRWVTSPGGLVSALAPVMTSRPNASWVGWSGSAGRAPDPFVQVGAMALQQSSIGGVANENVMESVDGAGT